MQAPSDMLSTLSVLGDVFPAEWPPPGTAKARGSAAQPHPPPGQMGYRARLARHALLHQTALSIAVHLCRLAPHSKQRTEHLWQMRQEGADVCSEPPHSTRYAYPLHAILPVPLPASNVLVDS